MPKHPIPSGRIYPDLTAFFDDDTNPTQVVVARELNIGPKHLSMIKCRERTPDLELAIKISQRCRVPLESLIATK